MSIKANLKACINNNLSLLCLVKLIKSTITKRIILSQAKENGASDIKMLGYITE